jgi:hypothetical protein
MLQGNRLIRAAQEQLQLSAASPRADGRAEITDAATDEWLVPVPRTPQGEQLARIFQGIRLPRWRPQTSSSVTSSEGIVATALLPGQTLLPEADAAVEQALWEAAIPEPDPNYVLTDAHQLAAKMLAVRLRLRKHCIGFFGVPGTGKNTLAREVAALFRLPYYSQDLDASLDLKELIGGTALEHGQTVERIGKITWFAQRGAVICLNEIQAVDPEMQTILHDMIGSRRIAIPSMEGKPRMLPVHPSTIFIVTWNPFRGRMPERALLSRLGAVEFPQPSDSEECRLVARMLSAADIDGTGREIPPSEVLRDQALFRDLRRLYEREELEVFPDLRFLENFAAFRRLLGVQVAKQTLVALAPQVPEDRERALRQIERLVANHFGELAEKPAPRS